MDIEELNKYLKLANFNGVTLNCEEKLHIELAFAQLKSDTQFDEILFWGKICGEILHLTL